MYLKNLDRPRLAKHVAGLIIISAIVFIALAKILGTRWGIITVFSEGFALVIYALLFYPWGYTSINEKNAYLGLMGFIALITGTAGIIFLLTPSLNAIHQILALIATFAFVWRFAGHLSYVCSYKMEVNRMMMAQILGNEY